MKYLDNPMKFLILFTILNIVLKLTNVIDWSWWWILSPIWIPFAIGVVVVLSFILVDWLFK